MLWDSPRSKLLAAARTNDLSEDVGLYHALIDELEATGTPPDKTRAEFIRRQVAGDKANDLFDMHRKDWGIPNFREEILTIDNFRRGFLWVFRDHTTSWCDDQEARFWFLNSQESIFVRRYEFWTCDNGYDECIDTRDGSFGDILRSLLADGDYEVLESPEFSKNELDTYIRSYNSNQGDFEIDEIIELYISNNPNYKA